MTDEQASLINMARESIVLLTVVIIVIVAGLAWTRIIKPFMDSQAEIATKVADALRSIQMTTDTLTRTSESHVTISKHLSEISQNMVEVTRNMSMVNK
jgi:menaquinone-dependent protoporphyrinogen IX oxidase